VARLDFALRREKIRARAVDNRRSTGGPAAARPSAYAPRQSATRPLQSSVVGFLATRVAPPFKARLDPPRRRSFSVNRARRRRAAKRSSDARAQAQHGVHQAAERNSGLFVVGSRFLVVLVFVRSYSSS
jgi:hypothetical protein